jgi:CubicO group peptidase (beta-lactamase class C family)
MRRALCGILLVTAIVSHPDPASTRSASLGDAPPGVADQSSSFDDRWSKVVTLYRQGLQEAGIVGSSLMFVKDGSVAGKAFEGYQDAATKRRVDEDTIYHWASITKTLTGVGIMQLRDRGLLSLDDPAVKYVPELREVHNPFGDVSQITIRQLMSHSAGFRAATWPWGGDQRWQPFEPTRWEQLVAMLPYTEVRFKPGTQYGYSNPGVIFLGRIIQLLSGDDYETYITKNIFMPLGMTRSFFDRAPYHLLEHRSHSYRMTNTVREGQPYRMFVEQPFDFDTGITVSNGGLNAPLGDMARWLGFLIGEPSTADRRAAYDGVLKRSSIDEMFVPVIRAKDGEGGSGEAVQAGLSCFIERHLGVELIGHSGNQNGFISHLYLHRPSRSGYVVSFNTDASGPERRQSTRAIDDDVRDGVIKEFFQPVR